MKDLYSVQLSPKQVARACEDYVLRLAGQDELVARAGITPEHELIVIVSTKRVRKAKVDKATEAHGAETRG